MSGIRKPENLSGKLPILTSFGVSLTRNSTQNTQNSSSRAVASGSRGVQISYFNIVWCFTHQKQYSKYSKLFCLRVYRPGAGLPPLIIAWPGQGFGRGSRLTVVARQKRLSEVSRNSSRNFDSIPDSLVNQGFGSVVRVRAGPLETLDS